MTPDFQEGNVRLFLGDCMVLSRVDAKIARGEKLTNGERLQRQGAIFNHSGKCAGPLVTTRRKTT